MKRTAISSRPSKAKRDFDAEYAKVLPTVLARGCQFKIYVLAAEHYAAIMPVLSDAIFQCDGRLLGHHAKGRRARDANLLSNLRCLCTKHHDYVHAHPRWAREVGLMVSRTS
jgi:hypothetical protein